MSYLFFFKFVSVFAVSSFNTFVFFIGYLFFTGPFFTYLISHLSCFAALLYPSIYLSPLPSAKRFSLFFAITTVTLLLRHFMIAESTTGTSKTPNLLIKPVAETSKTRFLDSKVVNTKGKKYVDIKPEDSEELKKTYVNLKPMRKYRFH